MTGTTGLDDVLPLSPLQEGMLFHALFDDQALDVYTVQLAVDLAGPVDAVRLRGAAQALLDRHACLRAAFALDHDPPVQVIVRGVRAPWAELDLRTRPAGERERELGHRMEHDRVARFDLQTPPLLRLLLVRMGAEQYRLVLTIHHILLDGWSLPLLLRDLFMLYGADGDSTTLAPVRPYRDYLAWLAGRDRQAAAAAWAQALRGLEEATLLAPAGRSGPPVLPDRVDAEISAELTARLGSVARSHGVTLNTVVQAAWAIVLSRSVGRSDVVFGTTVSGRPPELDGVESMVGLFINTIPVRVRLDPAESLLELLSRIQAEQSRLLEHQHVGLAELQRDTGLGDLFDTLTVFESYPLDVAGFTRALDGTGITVTGIEPRDSTHYPISLVAVPGARLEIALKYRPDVFGGGSVGVLVERLVRVLEVVAGEPDVRVGAVEVLSAPERAQLLVEFNDTTVAVAPSTVAELFAEQARRCPDAIAVQYGPRSLSYAELDRQTAHLATRLTAHGTGPEQVVAVCLPRSPELVLTLLAILRTGAAFVALQPDWPPARRHQICHSAHAHLLITTPAPDTPAPDTPAPEDPAPEDPAPEDPVPDGTTELHLTDLSTPGDQPGPPDTPPTPADPDNLAYVIFTSGSTGTPKGAMIRHGAIAARLRWQRELLHFDTNDAVLFKAPVGFDISMNEIFLPLISGARLVIAEPDGERDIEYLLDLIENHQISFTYLVSTMLDTLLQLPHLTHRARTLTHLWCGGETLGPALFTRFRTTLPTTTLYHGYGPAEATIGVTHQFYPPGHTRHSITIGTPNPNTRIYLLDNTLHPVPLGVTGEIYAAGDPLARGYVNNPTHTATHFIANPFTPTGSRLYRTGDLARWNPHGILEYLGRTDNQVKIRGMRVELEEIDTTLEQHPHIRQAITTLHTTPHNTTHLITYLTTTPTPPDHTQLHTWATTHLPHHMTPTHYITLPTLPRTPNGKINRKALPAPDFERADISTEFVSPHGAEEQTMARVWSEVLGVAQVGRNDNFFELGGDSLLAARLVFRLREVFEQHIALRELFRCQTVGALAATVHRDRPEPDPQRPGAGAGTEPGPVAWPDPLPPATPPRGEHVLLTGATGFFGAFLLRETLHRYRGTVHCLVRAQDAAQAWDKLRANLERYELSDEVLARNRIRVVVGDLARPRLGLADDDYDRLAREIDLIVHNGAHVDVLHSYDTLEAANVGGTRELLMLAATTSRKPLRFVSTSSAAGYRPRAAGTGSGYLESKWRAERMVADAQRHGIPATTYRVPRLAGDSRTGRGNDRDIILRTIGWILDLGAAPDVELSGHWIPVDEAARLLVGHQPGSAHTGSFVLTAQRPVRMTEIVEQARRMGHEIECKPAPEWRRDLADRSAEEHEVLTSALGLDSAGKQPDGNVPVSADGADAEGFVPIIARGVTEQVLRRYLHTLSLVHRTD